MIGANRRVSVLVKNDEIHPVSSMSKPQWSQLWHLWTVYVPRRAINGQLVLGKVWRRHDGRQWIYKKVTEYDHER